MATTHDFSTLRTADLLDYVVDVVDYVRGSTAPAPWQRAAEAAYGYLLQTDEISYDEQARAIRVPSATRPDVVYISNGSCSCEAFTRGQGVCWHRACARIVARALELRDLAAELLADAEAEGCAWYGAEEARAGARFRLAELQQYARDWDRDAEQQRQIFAPVEERRAALISKIAAARAVVAA